MRGLNSARAPFGDDDLIVDGFHAGHRHHRGLGELFEVIRAHAALQGHAPAIDLNAGFGGLFCVEISRTRVWSSARPRTRAGAPESS